MCLKASHFPPLRNTSRRKRLQETKCLPPKRKLFKTPDVFIFEKKFDEIFKQLLLIVYYSLIHLNLFFEVAIIIKNCLLYEKNVINLRPPCRNFIIINRNLRSKIALNLEEGCPARVLYARSVFSLPHSLPHSCESCRGRRV